MTSQRPRFWDPARRAAYLDHVAEKAEFAQRRKDGGATAEALDQIWASLGKSERSVIDALLACDRRSFVAPHDHPDLRSLVSKGLLAYPRGQGGSWMRAAKTSYSVPSAVWNKLSRLRDDSEEPAAPRARRTGKSARAVLDRLADGERLETRSDPHIGAG